MNPREFGWTADQNVTVKNPTSDDFKFKVHGKEYTVGGNETVRMPGFMAWLFVYNLAELLAQKAGEYENKWIDESIRAKYYAEVVVRADDLIQTIEPAEEPDPIERGDALKDADAAAKKAEEDRAAQAKADEEKAAAEQKAAEEKAAADAKAAADKKAADDKAKADKAKAGAAA